MSIDFDRFLDWAESRFDGVVIKGDEILLNSIFCEDRKHHLWCNPYGGKNENPAGVYHCWKSDQRGTLIGLVMLVDKCTYEDACDTLDAVNEGNLSDLERKVNEIFQKKAPEPTEEKKGLELPPDCYPFEDLPSSNNLRKAAELYLAERLIRKDGLMVCLRGRYRNRILIPYRDRSGSLIYYNGRYIGDPGDGLRYLGPPKELGIGKGDVMFVPEWPKAGTKIYITEGEFDAIALHQCGFHSAALGGKVLSERQVEMISGLSPVLCLDSDSAGRAAVPKMAQLLISRGFTRIHYVSAPAEHKDWNALLVAKGERILRHYINTQQKPYNDGIADWEATRMAIDNI